MELPEAAVSTWSRVEAASFFHTQGLFHPRNARRVVVPLPDLDVDVAGATDFTAKPSKELPWVLPMVSVICPTTDERRMFHPVLYESFARQHYERKELIVVDTGDVPSQFFC